MQEDYLYNKANNYQGGHIQTETGGAPLIEITKND